MPPSILLAIFMSIFDFQFNSSFKKKTYNWVIIFTQKCSNVKIEILNFFKKITIKIHGDN
jgi:hypothetical protein